MIQFDDTNENKELIKSVEIQKDQWGHIKLGPIIDHLNKMGLPV